MPRFEPFPALRYAAADLEALIAPPYDVLSEAEISALHLSSEHNISHLDDPRGGPERYAAAARTFAEWQHEDVLEADPGPTFTIYRLAFVDATGADRLISGVLGGLEIVDEGAGGVLPHERTTPKASTDRLELTRATEANLSPIWGLSLAPGLTDLLAEPGEPVGQVEVDGVEHRVERVDDPARIEAIRAALAAEDVLIADGHHRFQISRTYRDEVRARPAARPARPSRPWPSSASWSPTSSVSRPFTGSTPGWRSRPWLTRWTGASSGPPWGRWTALTRARWPRWPTRASWCCSGPRAPSG